MDFIKSFKKGLRIIEKKELKQFLRRLRKYERKIKLVSSAKTDITTQLKQKNNPRQN